MNTKDHDLEFSDFGRSPRFLPGWYILPTLIVGALIVCIANARAQDKSKQPTVGEVISVTNALSGLDAHQTGAVDTNGVPVTAPNNFRFSGTVRMAIAVNIDHGRTVFKNYQDAITAFRIQIAGPGKDVPKEKMDEFSKESAKMLEAPSGALLAHIREADLCLEAKPPACPVQNDIPVATLSQLLPIIDR